MNLSVADWKKWFAKHREEIFRDYFHFLKFKSVATDPAYDAETKQCAKWLSGYLQKSGLETHLWETSGQPVIFAEHNKAGPKRPTLLLYHHYDVQPVDPINLWDSDPFTPTLKNGAVYARGAQDNKGQCFYSAVALKALLELSDQLNFNLKVFIEGEEESGSNGTREALKSKGHELKSDYLLVVDTGLLAPGSPAITLGTRGILTLEVVCRGAKGDMHSGGAGGLAYNPIRALATALAKFWDKEGRVAIPGFYDGVETLSAQQIKEFDIQMDEERMIKDFGLRCVCPEPGYSVGESVSIRPTVEINGISGGYAGEGFKTVLPAVAKAKISCRLVPHQDPTDIFNKLKKALLSHMPKGMEVTLTVDHGAPAFRSRPDSVIAKLAAKAYEEVMQKPCKKILTGGSIPIIGELVEASGAEAVCMGFGLDTDQIHAPNEHFGLDRFELGFLTMGRIFAQLNERI